MNSHATDSPPSPRLAEDRPRFDFCFGAFITPLPTPKEVKQIEAEAKKAAKAAAKVKAAKGKNLKGKPKETKKTKTATHMLKTNEFELTLSCGRVVKYKAPYIVDSPEHREDEEDAEPLYRKREANVRNICSSADVYKQGKRFRAMTDL